MTSEKVNIDKLFKSFSNRFRGNANYIWFISLDSRKKLEVFIYWKNNRSTTRFKHIIERLRSFKRYTIPTEILRHNTIEFLTNDRLRKN